MGRFLSCDFVVGLQSGSRRHTLKFFRFPKIMQVNFNGLSLSDFDSCLCLTATTWIQSVLIITTVEWSVV